MPKSTHSFGREPCVQIIRRFRRLNEIAPAPPGGLFLCMRGKGGTNALSYGVWQQPRPTKPYTNTHQATF